MKFWWPFSNLLMNWETSSAQTQRLSRRWKVARPHNSICQSKNGNSLFWKPKRFPIGDLKPFLDKVPIKTAMANQSLLENCCLASFKYYRNYTHIYFHKIRTIYSKVLSEGGDLRATTPKVCKRKILPLEGRIAFLTKTRIGVFCSYVFYKLY